MRLIWGARASRVQRSRPGDVPDSSADRTFLQLFVTYTTRTFTSFGVNTESAYDWQRDQWLVPLNLFAQQMLKLGNQPMALQLGGRCYADGPAGVPEWGLRFQLTFMFPK